MQQSMEDRLKEIADRHSEVERLMSQPETASDPNAIRRLGREYSQLQHVVELWNDITRSQSDMEGAREMLADEDDAEVLEMARIEVEELQEKLDSLTAEIRLELLPKDETELADAVVEVRAGAGGDEAGLFAAALMRMYMRYSEAQGWSVELMSLSEGIPGSVKEAIFTVRGRGAYGKLRRESGVHRVQRVPETEGQGRIHTSAASVAVLPEAEDVDKLDDCRALASGDNESIEPVELSGQPDLRGIYSEPGKSLSVLQEVSLDRQNPYRCQITIPVGLTAPRWAWSARRVRAWSLPGPGIRRPGSRHP